jgi:iron complex outermembrane receptor protein
MLNKTIISLFIYVGSLPLIGQSLISFTGIVLDESTGKALDDVYIFIEGLDRYAYTDSLGTFHVSHLPLGRYHLTLRHIGCTPQKHFVQFTKDTVIYFLMDHYGHALTTVPVVGSAQSNSTSARQSLRIVDIESNTAANLSNLSEQLTGVSTVQTGYNISKPIVQGLYGNRIILLNNGITQSGQQWGLDHSPEIDPLMASSIEVIKGVASNRYQGSTLGSLLLVESGSIRRDPHLHGRVSYFFESNGKGHHTNLQLYQGNERFAWRATGTLRYTGDRYSPSYLLTNTGAQEANLALQFSYRHREGAYSNVYISTFNSRLGVLRGSQIGNLTDLALAMNQSVPFFTRDTFNYRIDAPNQQIGHHLGKWHYTDQRQDGLKFEAIIAFQANNRQEFDVRRFGNSEIPSLALLQFQTNAELIVTKTWQDLRILQAGIQNTFIDNTNYIATGVFPLVPDYFSIQQGAFLTYSMEKNRWLLEAGGRVDYLMQEVATVTRGVPREILRFSNRFLTYSGSVGLKYRLNRLWSTSYNIGVAKRNPGINELYSGGVHQGVSGIEEGDPLLRPELSVKQSLQLEGRLGEKWWLDIQVYHQYIQNFIFLNPQNEFRLTIRGAFPVFRYEQTLASLKGIDFTSRFYFIDHFYTTIRASFLIGNNQTSNEPLIFMPPNNLKLSFTYQFNKIGFFKETQLETGYTIVARQNRFVEAQDFLPPPEAYQLLNFKASSSIELGKLPINMFLQINNLTNTTYRNYLNRLRYFADEMGRNVVLGVIVKF